MFGENGTRAFFKLVAVVLGGSTVVVGIARVVLIDEVALEAAGLPFDLLGVAEIDEEAEGLGRGEAVGTIDISIELNLSDEILVILIKKFS